MLGHEPHGLSGATSALSGQALPLVPARDVVLSAESSDPLVVPSAELLFQGEYSRDVFDLIVSDGANRLVIHDYFRPGHRPDLVSPEGARLSGAVVDALTLGTPGERYAQAGAPAAAPTAIGRVESVGGGATAIRNGVTVVLAVGDLVYKGDTVQTDRGGSLALALIDGTTFSLASSARMVLNEMVYQAGASGNTSLLSLVQGSISFVAGQVAKTGDMRVDTPVATMGIRGTAVIVDITADNGSVRFSVVREPDGTVGSYVLYNRTTGAPLSTVASNDVFIVISNQGVVSQLPKTAAENAFDQGTIARVFEIARTAASNPIPGAPAPDVQVPGTGPAAPPADTTPAPAPGRTGDSPLASGTSPAITGASDGTAGDGRRGEGAAPQPPVPPTVTGAFPTITVAQALQAVQTLSAGPSAEPLAVEVSQNDAGEIVAAPISAPAAPPATPPGEGPAPSEPPPDRPAPVPPSVPPVAPQPLVSYALSVGANEGVAVTERDLGVLGRFVVGTDGVATRQAPVGERVTSVAAVTGVDAAVRPVSDTATAIGRYGVLVLNQDGSYGFLSAGADALALPERGVGTDRFRFTETDAQGREQTGELTLNVVGANDAPTAVSDLHRGVVLAGTTVFASTREAGVLFDDTDPDTGETASLQVVSAGAVAGPAVALAAGSATVQGLYGTLLIRADGTYQYSADRAGRLAAGEPETDRFGYTASDGRLGSEAFLDFAIEGLDDAPAGLADTRAIGEDAGAVLLDVLANDTDVDGGPKRVAAVGSAGHGLVAIAGDGTGVIYTPDADFSGTDSFTYALNGGGTATVTVTVQAADDAPRAASDATTLAEDAAATVIDVLANDTDVDGGPKRVAAVGSAGHGLVAIAGDGTGVIYTPDADFSGTDSFAYTLNGGETATVTVTVQAADDAPRAVSDATTLAEDAAATVIDVLANDTDVDGGPKRVASVGSAAHGFVAIAGDGTGVIYTPDADFSGTDSFTYTLNGGGTATVTVTVEAADDAPRVAAPVTGSAAEGTGPASVDLLRSAFDPEGRPLAIANLVWTENPGTSPGSLPPGFVLDGTTLRIDTDSSAFDGLGSGESFVARFAYGLTDGASTVAQTATVTIAGRNDAPSLDPAAGNPYLVSERPGTTGSTVPNPSPPLTGTLAYRDPDLRDTHALAAVTASLLGPGGIDVAAALGFTSAQLLGLLQLTLAAGPGGGTIGWAWSVQDRVLDRLPDGVELRLVYGVGVADAAGAVSRQDLVFLLRGANDAPVAIPGAGATPSATAVAVILSGADIDLGDTVESFRVTALSDGALYLDAALSQPVVPGAAIPAVANQVTLYLRPGPNTSGPVTITYVAHDGQADSAAATIVVEVAPGNDAPVLGGPVTGAATEGTGPAAVDLLASASDPEGRPLGIANLVWTDSSGGSLPAGFALDGTVLRIDTDDLAYDGLAAGQSVVFNFSYDVVDPDGGSTTQLATVTLAGTNDAAAIGGDTEAFVTEGDATADLSASGTLTIADVDGPSSFLPIGAVVGSAGYGVFSLSAAGAWTYGAFSPQDGFAEGETSIDSFTATAVDGTTQVVSVTITGRNDAPAIFALSPVTVLEGNAGTAAPVTVTVADRVAIFDPDVDDARVPYVSGSLVLASAPLGPPPATGTLAALFAVDAAAGTIGYDRAAFDYLAAGDIVTALFTFEASSGPDTRTAFLAVTIAGQNDAPVVTSALQTGSVDQATPQSGFDSGRIVATDPDRGAVLSYAVAQGTAAGSTSQAGTTAFSLDGFKIVRNGFVFYDDPFDDPAGVANRPPPSGPDFPNGNPGVYSVFGSFAEGGGRLSPVATGTSIGLGGVSPFVSTNALLESYISPVDPTRGLRSDDAFTVEARFDLSTLPADPRQAYGIRLTDVTAGGGGQPANVGQNVVELTVRRSTDGVVRAELRQVSFVGAGSSVLLDSRRIAPLSGDDQVVLRLSHDPAANGSDTGAVRASFDYLDGGAVTASRAIATPGHIFGYAPGSTTDTDWTRAQIVSYAPARSDTLIQGTYGRLDLSQAGEWYYHADPTNAAVRALAAGETLHDVFDVTVGDGTATVPQIIDVTLNGLNDAPVAMDSTLATERDTPRQGMASAADPDNGAVLTYALVGGPSHGVIQSGQGPGTFNVDGTFTYTPNTGYVGSDSFTYRVSDGSLTTPDTTVTITVLPPNVAPTSNDDRIVGALEDTLFIPVSALTYNDSDPDPDALLSVGSIPTFGTSGSAPELTAGFVRLDTNGAFTGSNAASFDFTYTAEDNRGAMSAPSAVRFVAGGGFAHVGGTGDEILLAPEYDAASPSRTLSLTGGGGRDVFVLNNASDDATITDYEEAQGFGFASGSGDVIDISRLMVARPGLAATSANDADYDLVPNLDGFLDLVYAPAGGGPGQVLAHLDDLLAGESHEVALIWFQHEAVLYHSVT